MRAVLHHTTQPEEHVDLEEDSAPPLIPVMRPYRLAGVQDGCAHYVPQETP